MHSVCFMNLWKLNNKKLMYAQGYVDFLLLFYCLFKIIIYLYIIIINYIECILIHIFQIGLFLLYSMHIYFNIVMLK